MDRHMIRTALLALPVLAGAACGSGASEPDEPKDAVDDGSGKAELVSPIRAQG